MSVVARASILMSFVVCAFPASSADRLLVPIDLTIGSFDRGRIRGEKVARSDVASGVLKVLVYGGLQAPDGGQSDIRTRLLREKGISVEVAGGCTSTEDESGFIKGYSNVMNSEIERRLGKGFWKDLDRRVSAGLRHASEGPGNANGRQ